MTILRTATEADLAAIKDLIRACEPVDRNALVMPDGEASFRTPSNWNDVVLIVDGAEVLAYGELGWAMQHNTYVCEITVRPDWRRRGLGRRILSWLRQRAGELGAGLMNSYKDSDQAAAAFVRAVGGQILGAWHHMAAYLPDAAAPAPRPLPAGYSIRQPVVGRDEQAFADIFAASFREHRFMRTPAVERVRERWAGPAFDPAAMALAEHAGAVVGVSAIRPAAVYRGGQLLASGHIGPVGVADDHRQRGLARALILANIGYARGQGWPAVDLSVDSINGPAIALYRSLGFEHNFDWCWWMLPA